LTLFLPTNFFCSYIARNFSEEITQAWRNENPAVDSVKFEVGSPAFSAPAEKMPEVTQPAAAAPAPAVAPETEKDALSAALDPRFTFDNFVVGAPNEFAYAAARRVAESDDVSFNPLYLYSSAGLGKTHLMHSIAWYIREHNPARRVVYLSAEKFMYLFIRAIRYKDTLSFKEELRNVDVLMIDDVQFLIGKENTQDEFFHTFNALVGSGKQIVLSADKPPVNLEGIEERLKTRLGSGLVADIHPTTYELRLGILESKAQNLGVYVPQDVISFLAEKITASVRELEGALLRVAAHVQLMGGEVTLERTCDILRDILSVLDRRVTIEEIQRKVAERYNIRLSEMMSKRRERSVVRPRQIAMFLAKNLTTKSLPDIGRAFNRDHTTVLHGIKAVEDLRAEDPAFREETDDLRRMLSV
ncbi:MAG: chromosomal replication initiator protein DnaA, partial [Alphaproteobacteria bacterium]|nr:chromosomal replication initiator protein DnaA [Alphaproteobacteria bacterium]